MNATSERPAYRAGPAGGVSPRGPGRPFRDRFPSDQPRRATGVTWGW